MSVIYIKPLFWILTISKKSCDYSRVTVTLLPCAFTTIYHVQICQDICLIAVSFLLYQYINISNTAFGNSAFHVRLKICRYYEVISEVRPTIGNSERGHFMGRVRLRTPGARVSKRSTAHCTVGGEVVIADLPSCYRPQLGQVRFGFLVEFYPILM